MSESYCNIVCDIDGTIIPLGSTGYEASVCTERTVRAVESATARGWRFSIATGRMRSAALRVHEQIGANGDLICYQGAMIVDGQSLEVLTHERIEPDIASAAIEYFMTQGLEIRVYVDDAIWVSPAGNQSDYVASRPSAEHKLTTDPLALAQLRPTTIVGIDRPALVVSHVEAVEKLLGESALVTRSLAHFCEVGSPRAGKVKALEWVSEYRGLDRRRTVAFGDGMGDVEMLKWAGLGVAVGTDIPEVLSASDESVAGPLCDGVAQKIEQLVAQ